MADASSRSSLEYVPRLDAASLAAALGRLRAGAVFALLPEAAAAHVPAVQAACRETGRGVCGAIFPRLIHDGRFVSSGAWLFSLGDEPARFGIVEQLEGTAEGAARRIADHALPALDAAPGAGLFLVFDATTPNVASIVDALYLELGQRARLLGVNAGSETFQPMPCVFDGTRVARGLLWLTRANPERTVLMHDYAATTEGSLCTATTGNRIATIDFKPAFDVYRDRMRALGVELTRENFYRYAAEYPFGIQLANGQLLIRMPTSVEADGSIHCVGEVPENAVLTIATAPPASAPATSQALRQRLVERGVGPALLLFYCAGRRMRLGDESEADLRSVLAETALPAGGATSLGEIGSQRATGYPGFHNGAFVCLGW